MQTLDHRLFLEQDFAILNPMQVDESHWRDLPSSVVGAEHFDCEHDQLPRLVVLRDLPREQRFELLDASDAFVAATGSPMFSALIRSPASGALFGSRAGDSLLLHDPVRGAFYFRYFDPRVLGHLIRLLTVDQLSRLLAPARTWLWFDPLSLAWDALDVAPRDDTDRTALALTAAQWDALSRIEIVNRVVRKWQAEQPAALLTPSVAQSIDGRVLEAIVDIGLTETDDLVEYAMNALRHGVGFHGTRAVQQALERVRRRDASYVTAIGELGSVASEPR